MEGEILLRITEFCISLSRPLFLFGRVLVVCTELLRFLERHLLEIFDNLLYTCLQGSQVVLEIGVGSITRTMATLEIKTAQIHGQETGIRIATVQFNVRET